MPYSSLSAEEVVNLLPALIAYVDRDMVYRFANARYEELFLHTAEEVVGKHLEDALPAALYSACAAHFEAALAGEPQEFETQLSRGDEVLTIDVALAPRRGPDGAVEGFFTMVRDHTARAREERRLRLQEARLEMVFDAAPFGLALAHADGHALKANRAFCELFGYAEEELATFRLRNLLHPDDREAVLELRGALEAGLTESVSFDTRALRKDGTERHFAVGISGVHATSGALSHLVLVCHDTTDRHDLQRTMHRQFSEQQRHLGRELHDAVAQPLTAVAMMANNLAHQLDDPASPAAESARTLVALASDANAKVYDLIRGVRPVDVDKDGLRSALDQLADSTQRLRDVWCTLECPHGLEFEDNDTATQLYRIASEAVHNAVQHGRARRVVIWIGDVDGQLVMRIVDDGVGLSSAKDSNGAGMGIRIMRHRAETIGAALEISEEDGTVVTVTLSR